MRLVTRESGYLLESSDVWIDFEVLTERIRDGHQAERSGEPDRAILHYLAAADLYQGDFLPGVFLDWAEVHREWLRSKVLLALERLIQLGFERGDYFAVVDYCHRMLEIEPLHEKAFQMLILVHGKLGQFSQVRRWFELCVSRLRTGLRVKPHDSTVRIYARAVRGEIVDRRLVAEAARR